MPGGPEKAIFPTLDFEKRLWKAGYQAIAGIDEAGRGAWAGPVCAAAVILPVDPKSIHELTGVRDSKLMTPGERQAWAGPIREACQAWGVGFASEGEIDVIGILAATKLAATRALANLSPDYLLTDFLTFPNFELPQTALVKGDRLSLSVAAASVLAKTSRDALMCQMDEVYPAYGFARHKGYGTLIHRQAINSMGLCAIHRKSFRILI